MWTTLTERIIALERDVVKKNEDVQELANEVLDEQDNMAAAIGTLFEHIHDLDSAAIGVSDCVTIAFSYLILLPVSPNGCSCRNHGSKAAGRCSVQRRSRIFDRIPGGFPPKSC